MNPHVYPAFLLTFVNVLGFSLLLPVLPFVVEQYGGSKAVYGALLSSYSIFQALGAPYLGKLSDSIGRKPVLMISQAGTLLSWLIFGLAYFIPNTPILGLALPLIVIAFSRVLDGITGGNNAVAQAYLTDITTKEEKNTIFGTVGGIVGIGFIIGPGVGGYLASGPYGYLGMVVGAACLSTVTLISIAVGLKESLQPENRRPRTQEPILNALRLIHRIRRLNPAPIIVNIFTIRAVFNIMMSAYIATIALFMIDLFAFNEQELGLFLLVVGVFIAFNQAIISKWFIKKIGAYQTMRLGIFLSIFGLISITLTDNLWLYIGLYYFLNLGISLTIPCFNTLLAQHADPKEAGEVMGISGSIVSIANAVIPIIAATLYGIYGPSLYLGLALLPIFCLLVCKSKFHEMPLSEEAQQ
ncbi:MAG: MFS transporter [Myxococcota bacterium]